MKDIESRAGRLLAAGASLLFKSTIPCERRGPGELLAPYPAKAHPALAQVRHLILGHHPQSLDDFPPSARKILNSVEWWLCLAMKGDEAEQVGRAVGVPLPSLRVSELSLPPLRWPL